MTAQHKKAALLFWWALLLLRIVWYYSIEPTYQDENTTTVINNEWITSQTGTQTPETSLVTIIVPENYESYSNSMIDFAQIWWQDPLPTIKFIQKDITVPFTNDLEKTSAQLAAEQFPTGGGPEKASVVYLKIVNTTAYVVLNIDVDWWAGVSVATAIIHPVVEKTLLQFENIEQVVFGYASWDTI